MNDLLLVRYQFNGEEGFDLAALGESLVGFDAIIKGLLDIVDLKDSVQVRTTRVKQGSVEIYNTFLYTTGPVPFGDVTMFIDFIKIAAPHLINDVITYFNTAHRGVNDFFADNPADQFVAEKILEYVAVYIVACLGIAKGLKKGGLSASEYQAAPNRVLAKLRLLVLGGHFRRAVKPITQGGATEIDIVKLGGEKRKEVKITERNVGNYLPDDNMILSDFTNGKRVKLVGELVVMQSTKGDRLKVKVEGIDQKFALLSGVLADGLKIEDFAHYFKKRILIDAEISRLTMYKPPLLIIHSITGLQVELLTE